jgi:hypothetical protein
VGALNELFTNFTFPESRMVADEELLPEHRKRLELGEDTRGSAIHSSLGRCEGAVVVGRRDVDDIFLCCKRRSEAGEVTPAALAPCQ